MCVDNPDCIVVDFGKNGGFARFLAFLNSVCGRCCPISAVFTLCLFDFLMKCSDFSVFWKILHFAPFSIIFIFCMYKMSCNWI